MHYILKFFFRGMDFVRGIFFFLMVNACGGTCRGIPRVGKGVVFKYPPHPGFAFGKSCDIGPFCFFDVPLGARLQVGDGVKLTAGVIISSAKEVLIGDDCLIAEWVSIRDSQHHYEEVSIIRTQGLESAGVIIGADVWVGRSAAIFMGSTVGDGCVVGAHSIVKRQVLEDGSVYVGVPVRKLRERSRCMHE